MEELNKLREDIEWLTVTVGAVCSFLVQEGICTSEEFDERFNFCLSDYDQYLAEYRDNKR